MTQPESGSGKQAAPAGLPAERLCRRCDVSQFAFATTDEIADAGYALGQDRAVDALRFGIGMRREGYNLYAMGPEGVGRHQIVRRLLEERAAAEKVSDDWCYVFNFAAPHRPRALRLPPGTGVEFRRDMQRLVEDLRTGIPAAFESDEYRARRHEIESEFNERQTHAMGAVEESASSQGIALLRTPAGFGFAPRQDDGVMNPQEFVKLPEQERKRLEAAIAALQEELEQVFHEMPKWRREAHRKLEELNRQVIRTAVNGLIEDVRLKYAALPEVLDHLSAAQEDVLDHADFFQQAKDGEQPTLFGIPLPQSEGGDSPLRRMEVNVLVEHAGQTGAPVVYEDNPTHDNLVGRIEHVAQLGALKTDFTLIQPGALHRANGGYLILDALRLLTQPFAWEALKRALRSRQINMESLGQALSLVSTVSLQPQPMPLDVKVVLIGQRLHYYLLHQYDPEFGALFKVVVDFEDDMERQPGSDLQFAGTVAAIARRESLRPLDRAAVAQVVERASRVAADSGKLSVQMMGLADLLRESDHWAAQSGHTLITAPDVRQAVAGMEARSGRVRSRLQEEVLRGTLLLDTSGRRAGQINGLSVMQLGGYVFGMPHRITARVRPGSGRVVDIEREAELGGPLHSKGVLILSGFLAGRYALGAPLSLSASLVFEQSYGGVEGDSASSAELYGLLSALADLPLAQSLAVTGSVNQHGDVQAIGGVNEKIEGFFDLCNARGLSGDQGVLIPASNEKHLMLKDEVVEAVAAGRFHIYPVASIDEGIALLTGMAAGAPGGDGRFPEGSVNNMVEQRLLKYAERSRGRDGSGERKANLRGRGRGRGKN
ncbi:MAG: ATP-dependent protease [Betaproteobacteria bacterium RIFCSPLOWO2_02_FULL_62_17]|nr:MAG: ATP-dependent protease [Betaproteobacteria bacterium RIFCSPLOWO2_02_FULL_62_17]